MAERVSVTISGGVAHVRLNRPEKMNALDVAMFEEIVGAGEALRSNDSVRAVVISGEGKAFCAGLDMAAFATMSEAGTFAIDLQPRTHGHANLPQQVAMVWRDLPVPVIAAIHGVAFGGGLQLAAGADMRIVHPEARLSIMEVKWGLVPDMAGMYLLRDLVRADVLAELVLSGRIIEGAEAQAIGLATAIDEDPLEAAMRSASAIASKNPHAVRAAKRLMTMRDDVLAARVLEAESREQAQLIGSPNQVEAVRATVERRPASFADGPF